ncbi:nucleoside permease [Pararhodonellum marinum]|uniref:nucleoside permease n=1 Tax=Pararhodonellum marinum TaxID=2755358 RepID=UPI00188E139C|nr:nucleoside permease [Pararhodonellum marinum]
MSNGIRVRLSFMMFLEFFIWGAWFVTLGTYLGSNLGASGTQISAAFSTQSLGAIIAPFIIGLIADRYFNAEKILGLLHLLGAVMMFMMYNAADFTAFYPFVLAYMILFMPTLALVNSVSFNQMLDPAKDFAVIRVWGTIGWIAAGLTISYVFFWDSQVGLDEGMLRNTFLMASIAALILGLYSFTLPPNPPKADKSKKLTLSEILGLDALGLLKDRNFAVFFITSILICIPLSFYYQITNPFLADIGVPNPTGLMTIGQGSEVLFMLLLPLFFSRYGIKKTLLFGMFAWVVRYVLFAYGDAGSGMFMLLIGIGLHGICYDFFFVSGQIYTDSKAGIKFKSAAQGMITLATYGVGMLIGYYVAGLVSDAFLSQNGLNDWQSIWLIPAGIAMAVVIFFLVFFKEQDLKKGKKQLKEAIK